MRIDDPVRTYLRQMGQISLLTREQEIPGYAREDLVLTMAKLYANEKSKARAWGDGTRLNEMQKVPKPPAPAPAKPAEAPAPAPVSAAAAPAPDKKVEP